jgi:hypothetical protein
MIPPDTHHLDFKIEAERDDSQKEQWRVHGYIFENGQWNHFFHGSDVYGTEQEAMSRMHLMVEAMSKDDAELISHLQEENLHLRERLNQIVEDIQVKDEQREKAIEDYEHMRVKLAKCHAEREALRQDSHDMADAQLRLVKETSAQIKKTSRVCFAKGVAVGLIIVSIATYIIARLSQ